MGEAADRTIARFTENLAMIETAIAAQAIDRNNRHGRNDAARNRALLQTSLTDVLARPLLQTLIANALNDTVQGLITAQAPFTAAIAVAALHTIPDVRLPELDQLQLLLRAVDDARPDSRDSYNGETGGHSHNGYQITQHYRAFFPLALRLITEPEYRLPERERDSLLRPYISRFDLDDWVAAAEPYFQPGTELPNHDPRPVFTEIIRPLFENEVLSRDLPEWGELIDEIGERIGGLEDLSAELYCDIIRLAVERGQLWVLGDELPRAIELNGDMLSRDLIADGLLALISDGAGISPILDVLDRHENFQPVAALARRGQQLLATCEYDRFDALRNASGPRFG